MFGWSWSKVKVVYMRTSFSACGKLFENTYMYFADNGSI
jgi:hypothetical protein